MDPIVAVEIFVYTIKCNEYVGNFMSGLDDGIALIIAVFIALFVYHIFNIIFCIK